MMDCPDTDRLVDGLEQEALDLELMAHLRVCPSCRMDLRIIRAIPETLRPARPVPEYLVRRTMIALTDAGSAAQQPWTTPLHVVTAGVLGAITAAVAVIGTGAFQGANLGELAAFSTVVGLAAAVVEVVVAPGLKPQAAGLKPQAG